MSDVTLDEFAAAHATGTAQVVDVREPTEYAAGHVSGAASIPMGQLPDRLDEVDRSKPVFVVCQAGGRSAVMTELMLQHGFDAHSVAGGTTAWTTAERRVEFGAPEGE